MAKGTILVIDDTAVTRDKLRVILEPAGFSVQEADGGISGIEALKKIPKLDFIICDYLMPDLDGLSCLTRAQEAGLLGDAAILMLTTEKIGTQVKVARQLNIMAWIIKPINADRILSGITAILDMKEKQT